MSERPSTHLNFRSQTQFRINKINEVKDYLIVEIQERETMIKKLSKYITAFDYFGKTLTVLSATSVEVSIISFATFIGFTWRNNKCKF